MSGWHIALVVFGAYIMVMMAQTRKGPIRWIGKGIVHVAIGAIILFVFNVFGNTYDFQIPLNLVTVSVAGALGIPGVLALICIKLFIL